MAKRKLNNAHRAGRRKCRRCKVVWNRVKGDLSNTCVRCQNHCIRCDVKLTTETRSKCNAKYGYAICRTCVTQRVMLRDRKPGQKEVNRDKHLIRTYGITANEYDDLYTLQDGGCYICGKVPKVGQRRLAVDHLHAKGEKKRNPREIRGRVRGLLCWNCNAAIGKFKDDITHLRKAADYLEEWPAQAVLKEKT